MLGGSLVDYNPSTLRAAWGCDPTLNVLHRSQVAREIIGARALNTTPRNDVVGQDLDTNPV
jgi:hypothetical protein